MRLYLDACAIQRPLDDRSHVRIVLESEAILSILALVEHGDVDLVSSDILEFETIRIPLSLRREHARAILALAEHFVSLSPAIEQRAQYFHGLGLKPMDALHLAASESADCDYFCTCDDRFLRRAKAIGGLVQSGVDSTAVGTVHHLRSEA